MIKNYLKIAWRNILRNKVFSFVNIAGLAIGLSCFTLIALYVVDELSYDRYNEKDYKNPEEHEEFRKRRLLVSAWQINELREGALIVRLQSGTMLLKAQR